MEEREQAWAHWSAEELHTLSFLLDSGRVIILTAADPKGVEILKTDMRRLLGCAQPTVISCYNLDQGPTVSLRKTKNMLDFANTKGLAASRIMFVDDNVLNVNTAWRSGIMA